MSYECQYCDQVFEKEENREIHKSNHFRNTGDIVKKGKKRNRNKDLISDWKRGAST